MAGTIVVDRLESDASYASSINVASQIQFSNTVRFSNSDIILGNTGNRIVTGGFNSITVRGPDGGEVYFGNNSVSTGRVSATPTEVRITASQPSAVITFMTNSTERIRIPSDAGGITFPATQAASSDPNTLDDYEEGTWTPVITNGTTGVTSYYWQSGLYRKIGNLVWIEVQISVNVVGISSGNIKFTGLPFPVAQKPGLGTQSKTIFTGTKYAGSPSGAISMIIESSSPSEILPYLTSDISTQLSYTSLASGGQWHFQGSYITTS